MLVLKILQQEDGHVDLESHSKDDELACVKSQVTGTDQM